jgi:hypothetical protein
MLKTLEDDLLSWSSSLGGKILGDKTLLENLETTKHIAAEIKITSATPDKARVLYQPAARCASVLYFILNDLIPSTPSTCSLCRYWFYI